MYAQTTRDDMKCFTEGELLFKVHHAMIPYLDRLKERTLAMVLGIGYKKKSNVARLFVDVPVGSGR